MKHYVCGFAFDADHKFVVLIKKNRPAKMAGLWNGIGGRILDGETPIDAMVREFDEETGLLSYASDWELFARIRESGVKGRVITFYHTQFPEDYLREAKTTTDEEVAVWGVDCLPEGMSNLHFLVLMAKNFPLRNMDFVYDIIETDSSNGESWSRTPPHPVTPPDKGPSILAPAYEAFLARSRQTSHIQQMDESRIAQLRAALAPHLSGEIEVLPGDAPDCSVGVEETGDPVQDDWDEIRSRVNQNSASKFNLLIAPFESEECPLDPQ